MGCVQGWGGAGGAGRQEGDGGREHFLLGRWKRTFQRKNVWAPSRACNLILGKSLNQHLYASSDNNIRI